MAAENEKLLALLKDGVYDCIPDGLILIDKEARLVFYNEAAKPFVKAEPGTPLADIWRKNFEIRKPDTLTPYPSSELPLMQALTASAMVRREMFLHCFSGNNIWLNVNAKPVYQEGELLGAIAIVRNITERKQREQELRAEERHYTLAFEQAPIGIAIVSMNGIWLRVNPAFCQMLGYADARSLEKRNFREFTYEDDLETNHLQLMEAIAQGASTFQMEKRYIHQTGRLVHALINVAVVRDDNGMPLNLISQVIDITERKRMEAELQQMAQYDMLTGLPNRRLFYDHLRLALERNKRHKRRLAVLFMDLNKFKAVNDQYGHAAGDEVLVTFASRLKSAVRKMDTVARLAGDEFVVIVEDLDMPDAALIVAQRILDAMQAPFILGETRLQMSSSIGCAVWKGVDESEDELMKRADDAMYAAKTHADGQGAIHLAED